MSSRTWDAFWDVGDAVVAAAAAHLPGFTCWVASSVGRFSGCPWKSTCNVSAAMAANGCEAPTAVSANPSRRSPANQSFARCAGTPTSANRCASDAMSERVSFTSKINSAGRLGPSGLTGWSSLARTGSAARVTCCTVGRCCCRGHRSSVASRPGGVLPTADVVGPPGSGRNAVPRVIVHARSSNGNPHPRALGHTGVCESLEPSAGSGVGAELASAVRTTAASSSWRRLAGSARSRWPVTSWVWCAPLTWSPSARRGKPASGRRSEGRPACRLTTVTAPD